MAFSVTTFKTRRTFTLSKVSTSMLMVMTDSQKLRQKFWKANLTTR